MKKLFILPLICLVLGIKIYSQSNNPFDSTGIKVKQSCIYILNKIDSGLIIDYSEQTLNTYSSLLPIQNTVSVDMIGEIYRSYYDKNFDLSGRVSESGFSNTFITNYLEIYDSIRSMNKTGFLSFLEEKSSEIQNLNNDNDKETLLKVCSIFYHLTLLDTVTCDGNNISLDEESQSYNRDGTFCEGSAGGQGGDIPCAIIGAAIGYFIGNLICGTLCGIGGAIVGFIVGDLLTK